MPIPEVVVFDLGRVLVDFDYSLVAERLRRRSRVPIDEAVSRLEHSSLLVDFETGRIGNRDFYRSVCALTGYSGTYDEFAVEFGDIFSPIQEMIDWQAALKAAGIPTYIFSNTNDLAVRHIRSAFPFFHGFDDYVYSHMVGAMKPQERIYQEVERVTGRTGPTIFYLDDKEENIAAGAQRGWRTVVHRTPKETLAAAVAAGLPGL